MTRLAGTWALCAALLLLAAGTAPAGAPRLCAGIAPLGELARNVAGDRAEVAVLLPARACPETFRPGPADVARLEGCGLLLTLGAAFEQPWIEELRRALPGLSVVDAAAGIAELGGESGADIRARGLTGVWLDPNQARLLARNVAAALERADPEGAAAYKANLAVLEARLTNLDTRLREIFRDAPRHAAFVADRPDWAWLAAAYGLEMLPVAGFEGEPDAATLKRVWRVALRRGAAAVVVRETCGAMSARALALQLRAQVIPVDPFAAGYEDNLLRAARRIRAALR